MIRGCRRFLLALWLTLSLGAALSSQSAVAGVLAALLFGVALYFHSWAKGRLLVDPLYAQPRESGEFFYAGQIVLIDCGRPAARRYHRRLYRSDAANLAGIALLGALAIGAAKAGLPLLSPLQYAVVFSLLLPAALGHFLASLALQALGLAWAAAQAESPPFLAFAAYLAAALTALLCYRSALDAVTFRGRREPAPVRAQAWTIFKNAGLGLALLLICDGLLPRKKPPQAQTPAPAPVEAAAPQPPPQPPSEPRGIGDQAPAPTGAEVPRPSSEPPQGPGAETAGDPFTSEQVSQAIAQLPEPGVDPKKLARALDRIRAGRVRDGRPDSGGSPISPEEFSAGLDRLQSSDRQAPDPQELARELYEMRSEAVSPDMSGELEPPATYEELTEAIAQAKSAGEQSLELEELARSLNKSRSKDGAAAPAGQAPRTVTAQDLSAAFERLGRPGGRSVKPEELARALNELEAARGGPESAAAGGGMPGAAPAAAAGPAATGAGGPGGPGAQAGPGGTAQGAPGASAAAPPASAESARGAAAPAAQTQPEAQPPKPAEPPPAPKREFDKRTLKTVLKAFGILLAAAGAALLLRRRRRRPQAEAEPAAASLPELLAQLSRVEDSQLSSREKVIAKYKMFLAFMASAQAAKKDFIPPTEYYLWLLGRFPDRQVALKDINDIFCAVAYGKRDVPAETLARYDSAFGIALAPEQPQPARSP